MSYCLARQLRKAVASPQLRCESAVRGLTRADAEPQPQDSHWSKVIRESEKIVGYSTSFMNLRLLSSDEFANVARHLRKLAGSNHPLLEIAKDLLYNQKTNSQPWGLVMLLLSKSAQRAGDAHSAADSQVYERQRILVELTEMMRIGHLIHKGLVNIPREKWNEDDTAAFGNKIGVLIGDYLLVTANGMLANLKNQDLSYVISSALRDMSEGEFFGDRGVQNLPLPGDPRAKVEGEDSYEISASTAPLEIDRVLGSARREWTLRTVLGGASLLGRGCQGAMLLADQPAASQDTAYLIGCHVGLAWQAASELQKITSDDTDVSLVSAPVLFALNDNSELYDLVKLAKEDLSQINMDELKRKVLKTDALNKTRILYEDHVKRASELVASRGSNPCVGVLKNVINIL